MVSLKFCPVQLVSGSFPEEQLPAVTLITMKTMSLNQIAQQIAKQWA